MLLSATLNGPPRAFQEARSPSLVRRPNSHARFPPIRSPILATVASSPYGIPQPPSANPSRVSSSGRPGPCITPSSVTQFITITFPISSPLLLPSHLLFFSHLISCSSVSARHPRARPVDSQDPRVIPASHPLHERDRPKSTPPPKSPTRAHAQRPFPDVMSSAEDRARHVGPPLWCEKLESSLEMHSVVTGGLVCHFDSNPRPVERRVVWPSWTARRR